VHTTRPLIIDVVGTAVALRAPAPILTELGKLLAEFAPAVLPARSVELEPDGDGRFRLLDAGTTVVSHIEPSIAAATVAWRLNAIAASTERHLVIHAGCVGGAGGVLLPARSGAGKSTLVAACLAAGMTYLSDEYAVVDLDLGTLVAYPKPIGLGEELVAPSQLGASVRTSVVATGIVFPRYKRDSPTASTRLDPAWTLLALAAHATNLTALGGRALPWLAGLATQCPAWQVTYGDATDALVGVRTAAGEPLVPLRPAEELARITSDTTTVVLGDQLAVLDERTGRVHLLNPSAAHVWTCVADSSTRAGLAELALARAPHGSLDPETVTATIEHLSRVGLLLRRPGDLAGQPQ
jgi:hypothetical protein